MSERSSKDPNANFAVLAFLGTLIAGVACLLVGIAAYFSGEPLASGVSFGMAGITFGLVASAFIRR